MTADYIRSILDYDPISGIFRNRVRRSQMPIGSIAGSPNSNGYIKIKIDRKLYKAHRLAYLWMTGNWPVDQIDHINGIKDDNRWSNLRPATRSQNLANTRRRADNKSGRKGVSWHKHNRKWVVQIRLDGTQYHLGYFTSLEEANACYIGAASILFGEFVRKEDQ